MSVFSRLFSGFGSNRKATNGKFNTTKNNHNVNPYGRSTVIHDYSVRFLKLWFGDNYKSVMERVSEHLSPSDCLYNWCSESINTKLPSYMNPNYHRAYYQPKHRK